MSRTDFIVRIIGKGQFKIIHKSYKINEIDNSIFTLIENYSEERRTSDHKTTQKDL
ncbi:MAG TPA: hypothetical protein VJU85_08505 [Nitrososphaeraceae archaeon]|nr:hypothetical protein [Nitrososphaeraceae archaeon]